MSQPYVVSRSLNQEVLKRARERGKLKVTFEEEIRLRSILYEATPTVVGPPIFQPPDKTPASKVVQVGNAPEGYGNLVEWSREQDRQILLVMYINAADMLGVTVTGFEWPDVLEVTEIDAIAYFSTDQGNPLASSVVGIVAAAAEVASALAGHPEAVPFIEKGRQYAQKMFAGTGEPTKPRDGYGAAVDSDYIARQEGGIIVTLPGSGGIYYSGEHESRWIKRGDNRWDKYRPDHVQHAFFPIRDQPGHNTRTLTSNGRLHFTPWDWHFEDNGGYYRVTARLTRREPDEIIVQ